MEMSVIVVKGLFVYKFKKTMYTIVYAKMLQNGLLLKHDIINKFKTKKEEITVKTQLSLKIINAFLLFYIEY